MDKKKADQLKKLEAESAELEKRILAEQNEKKRKRMIAKQETLVRKMRAVKSNQLISRDTKRSLVAYSFIAPNFIGFAVFTLIPIVFAFVLAFMEWDGNNAINFVGLKNFMRLPGDTFFVAALKNTIIYVIGTVPLTMVASMGLAILLNQKIRGRGFFRTVAFFPYVASLVAITAVWSMIFHPSKGPVIIVFLSLQKYFVEGVAATGLKG